MTYIGPRTTSTQNSIKVVLSLTISIVNIIATGDALAPQALHSTKNNPFVIVTWFTWCY